MLWFARRMHGDFLDEFIIAKQSTAFLADFLVFGPASNKQKETLDVPCLPTGSEAVQLHVCVVSTPRAERSMSLFVPSPLPTNTKAPDEQKVAKIAKKNHIGFTSHALRPSVRPYRCCTSLNQERTLPRRLSATFLASIDPTGNRRPRLTSAKPPRQPKPALFQVLGIGHEHLKFPLRRLARIVVAASATVAAAVSRLNNRFTRISITARGAES